MKILIKNVKIITQNKFREIIPKGFLIVEDERILHIEEGIPGSRVEKKCSKTLDADGLIVSPGFINTHTHLGESIYMDFIHGDYNLKKYLNTTDKLALNLDLEKGREIVCDYSILNFLKTGTSTICGGRTREAAEKWGIRNVSGYMLMKSSKLKNYSKAIEGKFLEEYQKADKNLTASAIFIHSLNAIDDEILLVVKKILNDKPNTKLMLHVAETKESEKDVIKKWGDSAVGVLKKVGLLSNQTILIHGSWITDRDMSLVKKAGSSIVCCLSSNLKVSDGTLDLVGLYGKGMSVCIATDGVVTSGTFNVLNEAKFCYLYHNKFERSNYIPAAEIFDMITIDAAKAIGMEYEIGSLELGKKADLVFLKVPHDNNNLVDNIIFNADLVGVEGLMVNGVLLMWDRKILNEKTSEADVLTKFMEFSAQKRKTTS